MPRLVSIAVESPKQYVAVDADGHVWRGRIDRDKSSQDRDMGKRQERRLADYIERIPGLTGLRVVRSVRDLLAVTAASVQRRLSG